MATLNLGRLKPVFRGSWNSATAYNVDDIVVRTNQSYISIQAGTNQDPATATAYWTLMAAKGSDGTDVGAALQNKEIAFKTNAGAVDGIPIGNSGEFLKVNSGATGYEFGAVSSDFVKLARTEVSSAVSSVSLDGFFTSDYDIYKIYISNWNNANNEWYKMHFNFSGSAYTSSNYDWVARWVYVNTSNSNDGNGTEKGVNSSYLPLTWWSVGPSDNCAIEITIQDPLSTSRNKFYRFETGSKDQGNTLHYFNGTGRLDANTSTAMSGVSFFANNNSNTTSGIFTLYGLKN